MRSSTIDIPLIIGGKEIRTNKQSKSHIPHEHMNILATFHEATEKEVRIAIDGNAMIFWFSYLFSFFFSFCF
jgi:1-pyrroline-5-carboxylate dehydrogenase